MDILLIGNTAREHALAWKQAESRRTGTIYTTSPYAGVDTLADYWDGTVAAWRHAHPGGLVLGENDGWIQKSDELSVSTGYRLLPCLTDSETVLAFPPVELIEQCAYCNGMTPQDAVQTIVDTLILPVVAREALRGMCSFAISAEDTPRLLGVRRGFGDWEAMAVLPLLRGELAGLLEACEDGSLAQRSLMLNGLSTAVLPYLTAPGAALSGLSQIANSTGVFIGAAQKNNEQLYAADACPLYVCGRAPTTAAAESAAQAALAIIREQSRGTA